MRLKQETKMKLFIYNQETREVVAIAEGETNKVCEEKAQIYTNDYSTTYSPAFGTVGGLINAAAPELL
jgi:flagellar motor component MotA